ncbi:hypothetical protein EZS27_003205 [termite gut metagenome]|uniref:Uncharacterized protein n=1 Tax=termite gut metagenome TaxID=433724 RepID=A0A5J4STN2_9ZZZZ
MFPFLIPESIVSTILKRLFNPVNRKVAVAPNVHASVGSVCQKSYPFFKKI